MRKTTLLTFAVLASMSAFAFTPVENRPEVTENDSKVIFFEGFEEGSDTWETVPVDSIVGMTYYNTQTQPTATTVLGTALYETVRDTTMYLFNGVKKGNEDDVAAGGYDKDFFLVKEDDPGDFSRSQGLEQYGADGGKKYFQYHAGAYLGSKESPSNGNLPAYRRNLLVRNLPIEDFTSYRITMYLKVDELGSSSTKFYASLLRGGSNSDCAFSMGYADDAANYQYKNEFAFETSDFMKGWNKITFMTYYLNDSIAEQFMYSGKYNSGWANNWTWYPDAQDSSFVLKYVKQPDKYFVRLSFVSDSTDYFLDNLSLTKSMIGGVEHDLNVLRVDFGYETDMDVICAKAKAATSIGAVEVPGRYFTVWGKLKDEYKESEEDPEWETVPIRSAEYHEDGYMYMFAEDFAEDEPLDFSWYDSVLVSFRNPVDSADICLHYDGTLFPKANDVEWIKNGKIVPDFTNEISMLNPYAGDGVYSLNENPPVLTYTPWEDGSFGLDGSIRKLSFKFSKKLEYDNLGKASELAYLRLTKSGKSELWTVESSTKDSIVFVRPESATEDLSGDYLLEIVNVKAANTGFGENVSFTWEFGKFDLNPKNEAVLQTNWLGDVSGTTERIIPSTLAVWNKEDGFKFGDGTTTGKCGLFQTVEAEPVYGYSCAMYFSSRKRSDPGYLYMGLVDSINLDAGKYSIFFLAGTYDKQMETTISYVNYDIAGKSKDTIAADMQKLTDKDKTVIATFTPTNVHAYSQWQTKKVWPSDYDAYSFTFSIPKKGNYVIIFSVKGNTSSNYGTLISDVTISKAQSISASYVTKFNKAMTDAGAMIATAQDSVKYQGTELNSFSQLVDSYQGWYSTSPSVYDNTTDLINTATEKMQLRMDTVDRFNEHYAEVGTKLAGFSGTDNYDLTAVQNLLQLYNDNTGFDFTAASATNARLTEIIQSFEEGMDAIDARLANMELYTAKLEQICNQLADSTAQTGFDEFAEMQTIYDQHKNDNLITPTDEQLAAMYDIICNGYNGYVFKVQYIEATTSRIKALYALCDTLGWDFNGQKDSILAEINTLQDSDEQLEKLLDAAARYMILNSFAQGDSLAGIDASALIPNYNLVAVAEGLDDMEDKDDFSRIASSKNVTSVFPHWTVSCSRGSVYPGDEAMDWKKYAHTFVAGLYTIAVTSCEITTDAVEGLPAAYYQVLANCKTNNTSNSSFYITVGKNKAVDGVSMTKSTVAKTYTYDSILVNNESLTLKYKRSSTSSTGHTHFAGVGLVIQGPVEGASYATAATAAKNELDEIATFVGSTSQKAIQTQYYGLDGRMIQAPKAGQIVIRKTTLENGRTVVDKVLVK